MTADIGAMLVQLDKRLAKVEAQSRLGSASLDDTALEVRDGTGALRGIVGQQGDGTTAVNIVNGGPPPAPSTPTAAPALGGVSAGWDGGFADDEVIPLDWARVEIHASDTAAFTPTADTLKATIETAQGGIVYIPSTVPLYVALLARNTSGAASPATSEVGPYAPRPVAGEIGIGEITETLISDGAVTTPKVFANAITTPKLDVGSVDATALKADAITGKIITGGVINGAEFHSDDGAGGLVDIEGGTVTATSSDGWKILIDPTQTFPVLAWFKPNGNTAAAINGSLTDTTAGLNISSGPFTDGAITDWRWHTYLGDGGGGTNFYRTRRIRNSDNTVFLGGQLLTTPTYASMSFLDSANPSTNTFCEVFNGSTKITNGRLVVDPPPTSLASVFVDADVAHTGMLFRADVNSVPKFQVTPAGAVVAAGSLSGTELAVTATTFTSYTPTVSGGGSATYTSRTGWYYKLGDLVYFNADFIVDVAGSGTTTMTITAPSNIERSSRQVFTCHAQSIYVSGLLANGAAHALESGSGNVIDRISVSNNSATNRDNILQGVHLLTGAHVTISGWYREA